MWQTQTIDYLQTSVIPVRLSCLTASGWPFVLSLWYLYEEGNLYCATQAWARVVAYLRRDGRCAYEVAADQPPYCGVRGQARAEIVPQRGGEILEQLLIRYLGNTESPLARRLLDKRASEVAIRLTPVNTFTWDYSARMAGMSMPRSAQKKCP